MGVYETIGGSLTERHGIPLGESAEEKARKFFDRLCSKYGDKEVLEAWNTACAQYDNPTTALSELGVILCIRSLFGSFIEEEQSSEKRFPNVEPAKVAGVNAAAAFRFVSDACEDDETPLTACRDGKRWVALPAGRRKEAIPYSTGNGVYRQLKKLETLGPIGSACLSRYSKTLRFYSPRPDGEACDLD